MLARNLISDEKHDTDHDGVTALMRHIELTVSVAPPSPLCFTLQMETTGTLIVKHDLPGPPMQSLNPDLHDQLWCWIKNVESPFSFFVFTKTLIFSEYLKYFLLKIRLSLARLFV